MGGVNAPRVECAIYKYTELFGMLRVNKVIK